MSNSQKRKVKKAKEKARLQQREARIRARSAEVIEKAYAEEHKQDPTLTRAAFDDWTNERARAKIVDDALVYMNLAGVTEYSPALLMSRATLDMYRAPEITASVLGPSRVGYGWRVCLYSAADGRPGQHLTSRIRPVSFTEKQRLATLGVLPRVQEAVLEVCTATISEHSGLLGHTRHFFRWREDMQGELIDTGMAKIPTGNQARRGNVIADEYFIPGVSDDILATPSLAVYMVEALKRSWSVTVSYQGSPGSVLLPTDATGVGALFTMRDVRPGCNRRDALLHWVSEHWRQNRYDPDEEVRVRQHLRGAKEFDWQGMRCQVQPSRLDQGLNETLAAQKKLTGSERRSKEAGT